MALGLGYWQMMYLIVLPQALKITIPNIVNTYIGLFKDTTLVVIVGIFDFLRTVEVSRIDPKWAAPTTSATGYAFAAMFYFIFCFGMSRYAKGVEARLQRTGRQTLNGTGLHEPSPASDVACPARTRAPSRSSACTSGTASSTCCATSTSRSTRGERIVICGPSGLRQVDHDPLHQPAGGAPAGPHRRRRHRADRRPEEDRRGPPRGRHGVPALQPVPASHHPGELHAGADLGAQDAQEGGRGGRDALPQQGEDPRAGATNIPASSPAASSSASPSRARCA